MEFAAVLGHFEIERFWGQAYRIQFCGVGDGCAARRLDRRKIDQLTELVKPIDEKYEAEVIVGSPVKTIEGSTFPNMVIYKFKNFAFRIGCQDFDSFGNSLDFCRSRFDQRTNSYTTDCSL